MSERDYESDMASLCDLINTHCRECGVVEASDYTLELMRAAVDRIVFKQRAEIERLRVYEVIAKSYHELPEQHHQGMLELLVKASFEAAEISHGRAAELLKCSIIDIREKGWVQGRKDEEIERLRAELAKCRRLLREACDWIDEGELFTIEWHKDAIVQAARRREVGMSEQHWFKASDPPSTSRRVMLRFDDDGERDCDGFYWRAEGAWYKSGGSKARRNSVHPKRWREVDERLRHCHMCGESEIDCDLEACFTCNQWTCAECSVEIESDEGDAIGVICCDCDAAARAAAGGTTG